jgi:hypothetical protein
MARNAGQRSEPLPLVAQRTASALGTLLRAFAGDGDQVWTLLPIEPDRLPDVPGVPQVELLSGDPPVGDDVLRWGGTGEVDAAVNDRRFALELARRHGWALPGAAVLHSVWAVEKHARETVTGPFVVRSPLAAAGRARAFGAGPEIDPDELNRVQRLFHAQDAVLFEPWVDRVEDLSVTGRVAKAGPEDVLAHRLHVDEVGRFRGVTIDPAFDPPAELLLAARTAGEALRDHGYRGPFGIDGFRWRDADGRLAVQPLCEINARLTFGHVARRFAERLGIARVELQVGHGEIPDGKGIVPLLTPGEEEGTAAWLATR